MLDRIMANPLVGLSPWILYSLIEGQGRLELSTALALGLAIAILLLNWARGGRPKVLELSDVVYFGGLVATVATASPGTRTWLELWGGEVANVALLAIVVGSVVIRQPFTLPYAKEQTPEELWAEPEFLEVNYLITWVWVAAFAIEAASGLFGDAVLRDSNNIWTGWILQTLPLIIAAQFTIWYPNRLDAVREGRAETAPTASDFVATITPWLTAVGIVSLAASAAPVWLGVAFIALGLGLTKVLESEASPDRDESPVVDAA